MTDGQKAPTREEYAEQKASDLYKVHCEKRDKVDSINTSMRSKLWLLKPFLLGSDVFEEKGQEEESDYETYEYLTTVMQDKAIEICIEIAKLKKEHDEKEKLKPDTWNQYVEKLEEARKEWDKLHGES